MAIEYRVIPRKILGGEDKGKTKYYATASNTGRTDLDALTRDAVKHGQWCRHSRRLVRPV